MKQKKLVSTAPLLRTFGENLAKNWYWEWYNEAGKRLKKYVPISPTVQERYVESEKIKAQLETGLTQKFKVFQSVIFQHLKPHLDEHCKPLRTSSTKDYNTVLRNFERWLLENSYKAMHPKKFLKADAEKFCRFLENEKKHNNATYNKYVNVLNFLFQYLVETDIIAKSPFKFIPTKKRHSVSVSAFKEDAVALLKPLLKEKNMTVYIACMVDMYAFIRPNEVRNLRLKHIDLQNNTITIDKEFSKNKKTQHVAIVAPLREILIEYIGECVEKEFFLLSENRAPGPTQISNKKVIRAHNAILKKEGFDTTKFKPYSWKHTGNSLAYKNGASIRFLKLQNRHHSEAMTEIYIKSIVPEDLVAGQEQFFNF